MLSPVGGKKYQFCWRSKQTHLTQSWDCSWKQTLPLQQNKLIPTLNKKSIKNSSNKTECQDQIIFNDKSPFNYRYFIYHRGFDSDMGWIITGCTKYPWKLVTLWLNQLELFLPGTFIFENICLETKYYKTWNILL